MFKKLINALSGQSSASNSGSKGANRTSADPVTYKSLTIVASPLAEGGQYKTAGSISQTENGETRTTEFIRADNHATLEEATTHSVNKAKQIIDERGSALFDSERC